MSAQSDPGIGSVTPSIGVIIDDPKHSLNSLTTESRVGDLFLFDCMVDGRTTGNSVADFLRTSPDLPGVIIQSASSLIGVISRRRFLEHMSHQFGRDLYLSRPITVLSQRITDEVLQVDATDRIDHTARRALQRPAEIAYEPILVDLRDGGHRLLSVDLLLQAQSHILALAIQEKEILLRDVEIHASQLQKTLQELRQAQDRLIQSEKMAALGQLVAGVSHEINTPIGVALTAASHLREQANKIQQVYSSGAMRKSDFQQFMDVVAESTTMVNSNIQRASKLIQSFKQLAIDQTSEQVRAFDLKRFIDELLMSLSPQLKKTPHRIEVLCPPDIRMRTFAGALAQVLTNVVMNAVMHAFGADQTGLIRIVAEPRDERVVLCVSDDGNGMSQEVLAKIYDPFFTTKRNEGGTGLGLHLVYNIVTKKLKGSIDCASQINSGTNFMVSLPLALQSESDTA